MDTTLALPRSPEEVAAEKIRFLREVMTHLSGQGVSFDDATLAGIVGHVVIVRGLDQNSPRDMEIAKAVVMVSLNFALDFVAEQRVRDRKEKTKLAAAVAVLKKNPLANLYAFAEKYLAEKLVDRAKELLKISTFTVQGDGSRRIYDLLTKEDFDALSEWAEGNLSDYPALPPATKAESDAIISELERIEAEIKLARKVNWKEILSVKDELTKFSANIFKREDQKTYAPFGSIWQAFLLSLMAKALGGGWDELVCSTRRPEFAQLKRFGAELFVFSNAATVARFISLILLEPEKIDERAVIKIAVKIGKTVKPENGVFIAECSTGEAEAILAAAGQRMTAFAQEAVSHYMAADIEKPTDREVDQFARTRLFVFIEGNQDARLACADAQLKEPWRKVANAKLEGLLASMAGFADWPKEEQLRLAEQTDWNHLIAAAQRDDLAHSVDVFDGLLARIKTADSRSEIIAKLVEGHDWDGEIILQYKDDIGLANKHPDVLKGIIRRVRWTTGLLCSFANSSVFRDLGDTAVKTAAANLSADDWRRLIGASRNNKTKEGTCRIWETMTMEQRAANLLFFTAAEAKLFFLGNRRRSARELLAEMTKVLDLALAKIMKTEGGWQRFEAWQRASGLLPFFDNDPSAPSGGFVDTFNRLCDKHRPKS